MQEPLHASGRGRRLAQPGVLGGVVFSISVAIALPWGCGADPLTALRVRVTFGAEVTIDQLLLEATVEGLAATPQLQTLPEQAGAPLASERRVVLIVPEAWSEHRVGVRITARFKGSDVARGSGAVTVALEKVVELAIVLCADGCDAGLSRCTPGGPQSCLTDARGCLVWGPASPCPSTTPHCSDGRCASACTDECTRGARQCATTTAYQLCGDHDEDVCADWGAPLACGLGESCVEGQCVPDCSGKACECKAGESTACQDRGECKGGVRACVDGQFGPCVWASEPTAEVCDGKDNDCNGVADDAEALVPQFCSMQRGACKGALQHCGGILGWQDCGDADYARLATSKGLVYEADETLCDGEDNDCDGLVDEAPNCAPYAHTIAIDGVNDFSAKERFPSGSRDYTGFISWDAERLFFAMQGAAVDTWHYEHKLIVYLSGAGTSTTTGMKINTQEPALPFAARYCFWFQTNDEIMGYRYDGSGWVPFSWVSAGDWKRSGDFVEFRVPRSLLGSDTTMRVHLSMINSLSGQEWSYASVPQTSFIDGYNRAYGAYYAFDLALPKAPASYQPKP